MREKGRKALSILLMLGLLLSFAACSTEPLNTGSDTTATDVSYGDEPDVEVQLGSGESAGGSDKDMGSQSASSSGNTNSQESGGNGSQELTVGGLSWAQVLAKMPSSLKGTTVEIYHWNPASEMTGATKVISDFEKATGITVKWTTENYTNYLSKLSARVAAGNSPDAVHLKTGLPTELVSLQPVSAAQFDFTDGAWDKWVMDSYTVKGKVYGVNLSNTHTQSPDMLFYNKALIAQYDLDDPYTLWKKGKWTYDAFMEMNRVFVKESKETSAWSIQDLSHYTAWYGIPGTLKFDGSKYTSLLNDSKLIKATQEILDYKNKERLATDWNETSFIQGKLLFFSGYGVLARRMNAYFSSMKTNGTLGVVPNPEITGQSRYQLFTELEAFGIAKGAKNAQAVPYFLRYYLDGANYDLNAFFCTTNALEVYKFCMQQANKLAPTYYASQTNYFGGTDVFWDELNSATGEQALSILKKNASLVEERLKRYNDQIGLMP